MSNTPLFAPSRPVVLWPYQARWVEEFAALAFRLEALLGNYVLRVDHIGSTAVPGLLAKDVLDVQLTVTDLTQTENLTRVLTEAGFQLRAGFVYDQFPDIPEHSADLRKLYLREPVGERRIHLHVREAERFNTRFALLMRDYLRAHWPACQAYGLLKQRAAALFANSIEGYLYIKEPVFHLLCHAAESWAAQSGWQFTGSIA
ncbi:GrpB family protein [Hymenobacter sp. YC55]|uniref:GrpB family protein n=1 Tax=Hymenobacter sp. YC55 TaxID=3034019 RepID=UPI0023F86025|nr:GrpB family protein [Hymenobacter sp. YC55]MDF7814972.1 GrpB family protein [Hymenobacter sp. YC55]